MPITNPQKSKFDEDPVMITDLDPKLRAKCLCTDASLINWINHWEVPEGPLGIKVAGQWRVYPQRLESFLKGHGIPKLR